MKKNILLVLAVLLSLTLCACTTSLAKVNREERAVEANAIINIEDYLTDVEEGTEVTYVIDEEKAEIVFTLTNGDKTQTLTKKVTILEPLGTFEDNVVINLYDGYTIEDLLELTDGVTVKEFALDEETGLLTVTLTNGERESTISTTAEVVKALAEWKNDDITIDTYTGFDVNDLVELGEGATAETDFNKETGELTVTVTKDDKVETYTVTANVINSDPDPKPWVYSSTVMDTNGGQIPFSAELTIYEDGFANYHGLISGTDKDVTPWLSSYNSESAVLMDRGYGKYFVRKR